tara:strand:+ start:452 stop:2779 length:2328 start_codon:yes stop_codon:yes gene_type:complete
MKKITLFIAALFLQPVLGYSQSATDWLFDDTSLAEVFIQIEQDSLDLILAPENSNSNYEFPATFIFKKEEKADTVFNIGFRLRGNTSRDSQKKSFKVSFNTFEKGREYKGLDKMNLNGEHNDPTILRAKLSWDIFQEINLPAPRANHVKLFINNDYYGLYLNVEHIDDEFLKDRFGSDDGNLYKSLYPADLSYISENPEDYKWSPNWADRRVYELKTNTEEDDYSDLASLISFFENSNTQDFINEIEDYINVDGVLRWMAVDILTGNWDNYWYNQNNFYLYFNVEENRFEFIPYDYDNTFGIDFIGPDWGTRDINNWGPDGANRPLTYRILEVEEYRNRLNFYINKIIEDFFNVDILFPEIDRIKALTEDAAEEDIYRTLDYEYDIEEYHNSFNSALGGHVKYGLKPYITTRINSALEQLQLENITPIIRSVHLELVRDSALNFYVDVLDEELASVKVIIPKIEGMDFITPLEIILSDDGLNIDKKANDGVYSGSLTEFLDREWLTYWIKATDIADNVNSSEIDTFEFKTLQSLLVINELMASNSSTIQDEGGAFSDWLEIYNPSDSLISLNGYFLSDNLTIKNKWAFPDTTIQPKGFLVVWVDDDEKEGPLHTSFNLSKEGEDIGLFFQSGDTYLTVDAFPFGEQTTDYSYGRISDGHSKFVFFESPTPGASNDGLINSIQLETDLPAEIQLFQNYPNPFNPETTISFQLNTSSDIKLEVFSIEGRLIQTLINARYLSGVHSIRFDASSLSSGMYFYRLKTENQSLTKRLVLIK